jgi:hypothetical protein
MSVNIASKTVAPLALNSLRDKRKKTKTVEWPKEEGQDNRMTKRRRTRQ